MRTAPLYTVILSLVFLTAGFTTGASSQMSGKSVKKAAVFSLSSDLNNWQMDKPNGWKLEDGALTIDQGGYIWTKSKFKDFKLEAEFKITKDCNSGIFFRTGDTKDPVQTGMEMQVYDNPSNPKPVKNDCGALYDLVAPSVLAMKPVGEWNSVVITCRGSKVAIEMNGKKIVTADLDKWTTPHKNPDGTENKFDKALKDFPREGYIGFQDHGTPVWYRNVRVTEMAVTSK